MTHIPAQTRRRVEVLDIRVRLERVAARGFEIACEPSTEVPQTRIHDRLIFVLSGVDPEDLAEVYGLIGLGRHIYARSSDVMHGRVSMLNVSQTVVDEWRDVVESLERLVAQGE